MAIKWKAGRFDPVVILRKIDAARTIGAAGDASFRGLDYEACLPALHSMLKFPPAADEVGDVSAIVWRALSTVRGPLTPTDFLAAANKELGVRLARREERYRLLTTASLKVTDAPSSVSCLGARIRFLRGDFPSRVKAYREELLKAHRPGVAEAPLSYVRVVVSVKAKYPEAAFNKALRALDTQRAIWCLLGNLSMQISFGTPSLTPVNVVRLGGHHTLHLPSGKSATGGMWFEPWFVEAKPFGFKQPAEARKSSRRAISRLGRSNYKETLVTALINYVRALDDADPNAAFLRLWASIESLTTPDHADYDKLVRRCAFLFRDGVYHRQMLEHLREYRHGSVHGARYSDDARPLCFQLQVYFRALLWFHLGNAEFFRSLEEANSFLDSPSDKNAIKRQLEMSRKALRFLS